MDAEHRHDLQKNELAEALQKLRRLDDPKTWYAIAIVAGVLLIYSGYKFWRHSAEQATEARWARLGAVPFGDEKSLDTSIAELRLLVNEAPEPGLKAIAQVRLAAALAEQQAQAPVGSAAGGEDPVQLLKDVAGNTSLPVTIQAAALYKLAAVYEARGDAAGAKEAYGRLSSEDRYKGTPFASFATFMSRDVEKQIAPVQFVPGFAPAPPSASAPATQSAPSSAESEPSDSTSQPAATPATSAPATQPAAPAP